MKKDLIGISDFSRGEICGFFQLAAEFKLQRKRRVAHRRLEGMVLAMIFEKPSLRTRVSFEAGMFDLGGTAIYLAPSDIGLGKRESIKDTAENLERWVHLIMARTFSHQAVAELAANCSIPVINALTDLLHPCQVLADLLTVIEHFGLNPADPDFSGLKFAFISDGNNVANSWVNAAAVLGFDFTMSCPEGYDPDPEIWREAQRRKAKIVLVRDPKAAARGVNVIYTDTWASMGKEAEADSRRKVFMPYQVNSELLALADPGVKVLHCQPAHRGEEITSEVMDGPHSIVMDEAENRLHIQKAVMVRLAEAAGLI